MVFCHTGRRREYNPSSIFNSRVQNDNYVAGHTAMIQGERGTEWGRYGVEAGEKVTVMMLVVGSGGGSITPSPSKRYSG